MDKTNETRQIQLTTSGTSDRPDDGCLVFREVRESGAVPLTSYTQTVDILETDSWNSENKDIFRLSWEGTVSSDAKFATCSLYNHPEIQTLILHKLKLEDFKLLRHLAEGLFKDYRCRLMSVQKEPVILNCVIMDFAAFQYFKRSSNDVKQFLIDVFDDTEATHHIEVTITEVERFEMDSSISCLPKSELSTFDCRLVSQLNAIEARYQTQKARNRDILLLLRKLRRLREVQAVQTRSFEEEVTNNRMVGIDTQSEARAIEDMQKTACSTVQTEVGETTDDGIVIISEDDRDTNETEDSRDVVLPSNISDISSSHPLNDNHRSLLAVATEQDRTTECEQNGKIASCDRTMVGPPPRADGRDTVFLFDLSSNVDKAETNFDLQRMKEFVLKVVEGVEDISSRFDVHENIGLVIRIKNDWITCLPSNDYNTIKRTIVNLTVGDKVPLSDTLREGIEFTIANGKDFVHSDDHGIPPRIIVLTNYTKEGHGGLFTDQDIIEKDFIIEAMQKASQILWIPVGNADRPYLHSLVTVTKGHMMDENAIDVISKCQLMQVATGKIVHFLKNESASLTGDFERDLEFLMDIYTNGFDQASKQTVERIVRTFRVERSRAAPPDSRGVPDMPPIGSRVVRGRDWMWFDQDGMGPGTVIRHMDGFVSVRWDNGHCGKYRYGAFDSYDVKEVHDRPRRKSSENVISVGCEVIRGPDWIFGMQDGGAGGVGVVTQCTPGGILEVQWKRNGYIDVYKCGAEGQIQVMPREWDQGPNTAESGTSPSQSQQQCHKPNIKVKEELDRQRDKPSQNVHWSNGDVPSVASNVLQHPSVNASLAVSSLSLDRTAETGSMLNSESSELPGETSRAGQTDDHCLWSWLDDDGQWIPYSEENNEALHRCFRLRNDGSCLLRKDSKSCRVLFKTMTEKCCDDNKRRKVRRTGKD